MIVNRSAAEFWWNTISRKNIEIPSDVAYYETFRNELKSVTWEKVHAKRTDRIRRCEDFKRRNGIVKAIPCIVWVFNNEGKFPFGGTYVLIKTLRSETYLNFRNEQPDLILRIMELFPCGILPMIENFDLWAEQFIIQHKKKKPAIDENGKARPEGSTFAKCVVRNGNIENITL